MQPYDGLGQKHILGYLPSTVIKKILEGAITSSSNMPSSIPLGKVVSLFADISGFTKLSEDFSKEGRQGAEYLAFCLNRYMEQLRNNGGDIFKFAGDAILVIWPEDEEKGEQSKNKKLRVSCLRAVRCARTIQSTLNNFEMVKGKFLSVKIGIALGECKILFVGGIFQRNEYLIVGESMKQACLCECHCTGGGETVVSDIVYDILKDIYDFEEAEECDTLSFEGHRYYKIIKPLTRRNTTQIDNISIRKKYSIEIIKSKIPILRTYLPAAISLYLDIEKENWSKENRLLTIMFLNLSIDLQDMQNEEGEQYIQKITNKVQECVYRTRGSLNKFLIDDKGSVMLIVWGLPPISAHDDAVRAVCTGLDIISLFKKEGIKCGAKIGITTGCCFTGICGSMGGRKEYSLLGEIVNKSARFMQMSMNICKEKMKRNPNDENANYQITLCKETKQLIENKIPSRWLCKSKIKGFANPVDFYEPVPYRKLINVISNEIRTHNENPYPDLLIPERANLTSLFNSSFIIGNKVPLSELLECLVKCYESNISKTILIRGVIGSGKSLIVRNVLEKFYQRENLFITPEKKFLFVTTQNPSISFTPGNGIIGFIQYIFMELLEVLNTTKKKVQVVREFEMELDDIGVLLSEDLCISYIHYIEEILQIELTPHYSFINPSLHVGQFFNIKELEEKKFYEKREYQQGVSDKICSFFYKLIKIYREKIIPKYPLIIVIEDLNLVDKISIDLIKYLSEKNKTEDEKIQGMMIILTYQDSLNPFDKTTQLNNFSFVDIMYNIGNIYNSFDDFVLDHFIVKNKIITSKIDKRVKDWICSNFFSNSPLLMGEILNALIEQKFLVVIDYVVTPTQKFEEIVQLRDYSSIKIPFIIEKVIGNIIDSLSPIEIIILKHASVIGMIFDIEILYKIISDNKISFRDLVQMIYSFSSINLIEILYNANVENLVAKFSIPFLREVLYQRMTVETRNSIHLNITKIMQCSKRKYFTDKEELLHLRNHLLQGEMTLIERMNETFGNHDSVKELKSENTWIIKDICQKLKKIDLNINEDNDDTFNGIFPFIMSGLCYKKSSKNITWSKRFLVLSKNKLIYWHNKEEFLRNQMPLGVCKLKDIYHVKIGEDYDLLAHKKNILIFKTNFYMKDDILKENRCFCLSFPSRKELNWWITSINFLRINAQYDDFCLSFGSIPLPLSYEDKDKKKFNLVKQFIFQKDTSITQNLSHYKLSYSFYNSKSVAQNLSQDKKCSIFSKYYSHPSVNEKDEKEYQTTKTLIFEIIKKGIAKVLQTFQKNILLCNNI